MRSSRANQAHLSGCSSLPSCSFVHFSRVESLLSFLYFLCPPSFSSLLPPLCFYCVSLLLFFLLCTSYSLLICLFLLFLHFLPLACVHFHPLLSRYLPFFSHSFLPPSVPPVNISSVLATSFLPILSTFKTDRRTISMIKSFVLKSVFHSISSAVKFYCKKFFLDINNIGIIIMIIDLSPHPTFFSPCYCTSHLRHQ